MSELQKALYKVAQKGYVVVKDGHTLDFISSRWVILQEDEIIFYFEDLDEAIIKFEEITK